MTDTPGHPRSRPTQAPAAEEAPTTEAAPAGGSRRRRPGGRGGRPPRPSPTRCVRGVLATPAGRAGRRHRRVPPRPGDDLWVRAGPGLARGRGGGPSTTAAAPLLRLPSPGIDWLPSPFGRDMGQPGGPRRRRRRRRRQRDPAPSSPASPGREPLQVFAGSSPPGGVLASPSRPTSATDAPTVDSWTPVYAGADWHEAQTYEMYGFTFVGHPEPALHLPASRLRGPPAAQGLPAAGPAGEALARHRRRRAVPGEEASEDEEAAGDCDHRPPATGVHRRPGRRRPGRTSRSDRA